MISTKQPERRRRRGAVLAAALACLLITVLLSAALATSALQRQRQLKMHERQLQAEWLANSAVHLAAARLRADPEYQGETWSPTQTDLESRYAGETVITVTAADNDRRRVTVEILYPDDPIDRTRLEKTIVARTVPDESPAP
jgi:hypothetical protein